MVQAFAELLVGEDPVRPQVRPRDADGWGSWRPTSGVPAGWSPAAALRPNSLEALHALTPDGFEQWVAECFAALGYRAQRTGTHGTGGDHGIDLVVMRPGERAVVQCKNFRAWAVGEPTIRDLFGVMHAAQADRAYLVTTGRVTAPAWRWARDKPIEIWDRRRVAELAAGVDPIPAPGVAELSAVLRRAPGTGPSDAPSQTPSLTCPRCGAALVERVNRKTSERFEGCSTFPRCRFTRQPAPEMSLSAAARVVPSNVSTFATQGGAQVDRWPRRLGGHL